MCSLENISKETPPADMPPCVFILEEALSVRALQEMLSVNNNGFDYLSCLSTSTSQDKLAFDVGLNAKAQNESCWWTIHPASKQRSVGEKVRIGDDLIIVSVSSERYLHVYGESCSIHGVIASFQQTLWTMLPVSNGVVRQKSMDMVLGGDVVRLIHGDEALAVCSPDSDEVSSGQSQPGGGAANGGFGSTSPGGPQQQAASQQQKVLSPAHHQQDLDLTGGVQKSLSVLYELGVVSTNARSLWRIEHVKTKWSAGFFSWNACFRLRHVTSGRYLGVMPSEANSSARCDVVMLAPHDTNEAASVFLLRSTKDERKRNEEPPIEGMGEPDIRLGETLTYLQHAASGRWLSYEAYETRKRGVGRVEVKKAVLLSEGHMDDLFTFVRAQDEEVKSASAIRRCTVVFGRFIATLRLFVQLQHYQADQQAFHHTTASVSSSTVIQHQQQLVTTSLTSGHLLGEVRQCLEDSIEFFAQPHAHEEHEVRQAKLTALRNRQILFQNEGMIGCVLETIEQFTGTFQTRREFAQLVGGAGGGSGTGDDKSHQEQYDRLGNYLYLLLAALIRGNRDNCAQFATPTRLDWLFNRLELQQGFAEGVLDVLHCVLTDSDEALYLITKRHIETMIGLLDKQGRDPRVLQALCSLCLSRQGGAVRLNQDLIHSTLLPQRDLLLQTKLIDQCVSIRPNIFVGYKDGGAMYPRWYFEVIIDTIETATHQPTNIRIGWANTEGFDAMPGGGPGWGAAGLGDDLYSYAFDGAYLWTGGKAKRVAIGTTTGSSSEHGQLMQDDEDENNPPVIQQSPSTCVSQLKSGDVIGCLLDLTGPVIQFNLNGRLVRGYFQDFNTTGLFYPCLSMTAKASCRFLLGGSQGKLRHGPPPSYSQISDARQPGHGLKLEPVFSFGHPDKAIYSGPLESPTPQQSVYVPQVIPIYQLQMQANENFEYLRDRLAENLHEIWAMHKIEQGWKFGESRDEQQRLHPCLTIFAKLPQADKQYSTNLAYETLRTIINLGYKITHEPLPEGTRLKTVKLGNSFLQSANGYKPQPLDLTRIRLSRQLEALVDLLAENTHNIWARDRIGQGWTYGFTEDHGQKRSPHLVPFSEVDPIIKHSNRKTATETVKTLLVYGYSLDQVGSELSEGVRSGYGDSSEHVRNYRGQTTRAVTSGKWYYEVELLTQGFAHIGWAKTNALPDSIVGANGRSFAFAAHQARKWHRTSTAYGTICQPRDVVGCMIDLTDRTIAFTLNGELMMDPLGQEMAFKNIKVDEGYVPAFSLGRGQKMKVNFGNDVRTLKFFTYCGLQEGYKPLCVNMSRQMPLWYSREDASLFTDIDSNHSSLEVNAPSGSVPIFKMSSKQADATSLAQSEPLFLRLSLGTQCRHEFTTRSLTDRHSQIDLVRRQVEPRLVEAPVQPSQTGPASNLQMMNQNITSSTLEMRDRRQKKMRLGMMFKKGRSRDASPADVGSTLGAGGGSLVSASSGNSKRANQQQGQGSGGSNSLVSTGPPGSFTPTNHQQQPIFSAQLVGPQTAQMVTATSSPMDDISSTSMIPTTAMMMATDHSSSNTTANLLPVVELIDEYSFNVLILPGQDPNLVHIGWVTSFFKLPRQTPTAMTATVESPDFSPSSGRGDFDASTGQPLSSKSSGAYYSPSGTSVTSQQTELFTMRQVAVCLLEADLKLKSAVAERSSFMINLGHLLAKMATAEDMGRRMSQGLTVTSWVDTATGILGFDLNGRDSGITFRVEPSTRLYAAVFYRPTVREAVHFELTGRNRYTLPISNSMLRRTPPNIMSQTAPMRLKVQDLQKTHWARVPSSTLFIYSMKISEQRGWSTILEDPVSELTVRLPEAGRCLTAFELEEKPSLLNFHSYTLELYRALCCHANNNVAQALTEHVDVDQLLHVVGASDMPGPLRYGFMQLMLTMHVESHVKLKQVTGREFIVPMFTTLSSMTTVRNLSVSSPLSPGFELPKGMDRGYSDQLMQNDSGANEDDDLDEYDFECIPAVHEHASIRPTSKVDLHVLIPGADGTGLLMESAGSPPPPAGLLKLAECPVFPLDKLKSICLTRLVEAVNQGGLVRDPVGGNFEHLFLPLLMTINSLLVTGNLDSSDLTTILAILDPKSTKGMRTVKSVPVTSSLLDFPLPESVKLEVCRLLHNVCDLQLRNRVEQVVKFTGRFVSEAQADQYSRYIAIKEANLSSAVAARRTREFRCPAAVQMINLLRMPGPGGPTGRLEEGVEDGSSASNVVPASGDDGEAGNNEVLFSSNTETSVEDDLESVDENRCGEVVKDLIRRFHKRLIDYLGVMKSDEQRQAEEEAADQSHQSNRVNRNGYANLGFDFLSTPLTRPNGGGANADSQSLSSLAIVYPPEELQRELPTLRLIPPELGNPEEGSGKPVWPLQLLWNLVARRDTSMSDGGKLVKDKLGGSKMAILDNQNESVDLTKFCRGSNQLTSLIVKTMLKWARSDFIENLNLIREMFYALFRQYNAIEELRDALKKTYIIAPPAIDEVSRLLRSLGRVRCLLGVQLGCNEEMLLKNCLWDLMNNKIFFQHPDLIRCLAVHETVMQLMVQTLAKASLDQQPAANGGRTSAIAAQGELVPTDSTTNPVITVGTPSTYSSSGLPVVQEENLQHHLMPHGDQGEQSHPQQEAGSTSSTGPTEMVVQCCRFLCYFCRTSRDNQKAMFEHLSYMLENSSMLLARPSLRGSCPLDVAYSSLMDNNELALALREKQLEKVAVYLSRCGVQPNAEMLTRGYPDIGWDPVEGERFLDFLRFTVWVNGETVEENANLVVRLLIRRPECLGPALRGSSKAAKPPQQEGSAPGGPDQPTMAGSVSLMASDTNEDANSSSVGGGLYKAMKEGLVMSAQIKLVKMAQEAEAGGLNPEEEDLGWRSVMMDYEDANLFAPLPYNFENLPSEDDADYIDLGAAILNFHSVLVNLLGFCAPDLDTTKSESIRARAILQSLVSMADLEGVLSLRFLLPPPKLDVQINEEGEEEWVDKAGMPPGLLPEHKASVVLFLERVYGITESATFLRLLENAFLPDLRAAMLLDSTAGSDSDMALALNRYLCNNVLTLLTRYAYFLGEEVATGGLFEATLQTTYRLSKCHSITSHQREVACDFLIALMQQIRPPMMTALLKKMVIDLRTLSSESTVCLRVLTEFYQRCGTYYSSGGWNGDQSGSSNQPISSSGAAGPSAEGAPSTATGAGAGVGSASEEERNLTAQLFIVIFDNLSRQPYEPVLFSYALPCLCAIGCALPADYSFNLLSVQPHLSASGTMFMSSGQPDYGSDSMTFGAGGLLGVSSPTSPAVTNDDHDQFVPRPIDITQVKLPSALNLLVDRFAQHCHDTWALDLIDQGFVCGPQVDEAKRTHPNLAAFQQLPQHEQLRYIQPVSDTLRAMLASGWAIDAEAARTDMDQSSPHNQLSGSTGQERNKQRRSTVLADHSMSYNPTPRDLHGVNLSKEMNDLAELLADNAHNIWACQKMSDLSAIGGGVHQLLVPYELLTDNERKRYRKLTHELIRYLQYHGYRLQSNSQSTSPQTMTSNRHGHAAAAAYDRSGAGAGANTPSTRFAYGLLSKLLDYVESAMSTVRETMPSNRYSVHRSCVLSSQDMKFFVKVVLPLVERYFEYQHTYFLDKKAGASLEERKMAATLFCKLFFMLRVKQNAFGHDVQIAVSCLQGLIQTIDVKAILKMGTAEDFVRSKLLPFFVNCADDLCIVVKNLDSNRYSHVKGTIKRGACSLDYVHMVLIPLLKSMFEHLGKNECGEDLLVGNVQVTCYRILNALYKLGTSGTKHSTRVQFSEEMNRHRALIGECLAALAQAFPVAFLEADLIRNNPVSIMFDKTEGEFSLEARDVLQQLAQTMPNLLAMIEEVEQLVDSGSAASSMTSAPHLIEVTLPMLCSYLPTWWSKGPESGLGAGGPSPATAARTSRSGSEMVVGSAANKWLVDRAVGPLTTVTAELMNRVLGSVLQLIQNHIDVSQAPWMTRIATRTQPIVANSTADMLGLYFLPVSERLLEHALIVERVEATFMAEKRAGNEAVGEREEELLQLVEVLVRNLYAFYPLLIKFVDRHRSAWLKRPTPETQRLFTAVAHMFLIWTKATKFKREEENFVHAHEIDHLSLIVPSGGSAGGSSGSSRSRSSGNGKMELSSGKTTKRARPSLHTSLTVACIKRLLPVETNSHHHNSIFFDPPSKGLSQLGGREQELVLYAKRKLIKHESDWKIQSQLVDALRHSQTVDDPLGRSWQKQLYQKIDKNIASTGRLASTSESTLDQIVDRILTLSKVMHGLYWVEHPPTIAKGAWKKLVSSQRKRAVMACFRMVPLYAMPLHRAANLFIKGYIQEWLDYEESLGVILINDITRDHEQGALRAPSVEDNGSGDRMMAIMESGSSSYDTNSDKLAAITAGGSDPIDLYDSSDLLAIPSDKSVPSSASDQQDSQLTSSPTSSNDSTTDSTIKSALASAAKKPDALTQLLTALSRSAQDQASDDALYLAYARIMAKSCSGEDDDEDDDENEEEALSPQEQEERKQQLLSEQNRLADRGSAEMVLLQLAASKGEATLVAQASIELGIALLLDGNTTVQGRMLEFLNQKQLTAFFLSLSGLMQNCSVLDLDIFERCNKAEGLAVGSSDMEGITNLHDVEFTCKIFRFLQLLCEGHNLAFQDYLRTQAGSTSSVNLIISTVDYLLRLQESIMDFYWHYSNKATIDESGKHNFIKAIKIVKQVLRSLTEYIQGPCLGNQLALANSRLWDAVGGCIYVSAQMQDKLSRDPDQLDLLNEFLNLQKELMIMLLSMLEGNVLNGPIAKQMVDTLAESSAYVEMILKFFDIFLRMKAITTSEAFLAFDINGDGWISQREFRAALEQQKTYHDEEIAYIIACVDANSDGKIDFREFTERFYNPAEDIGFNFALLLTNLSEHVPFDPRLGRLVDKARGVLDVFEPHLGRIEITGSNGSVERVYFEIRQQHIDQWEAPQIKESKRSFLHSVVGESGDKEKLEAFVNFCEDTIFEMQHAQEINGDEADTTLNRVAAFNRFMQVTRLALVTNFIYTVISCLHPTRIANGYSRLRQMTFTDIFLTLFGLLVGLLIFFGRTGFYVINLIYQIVVAFASDHTVAGSSKRLLRSGRALTVSPSIDSANQPWWLLSEEQQLLIERIDPEELAAAQAQYAASQAIKEAPPSPQSNEQGRAGKKSLLSSIASPTPPRRGGDEGAEEEELEGGSKGGGDKSSAAPASPTPTFNTRGYLISFFAGNFYRFKITALIMAFLINFMLLFFKVQHQLDDPASDDDELTGAEAVADASSSDWMQATEKSSSYSGPLLAGMAFIHTLLSFSMIIAYYYLKVPLVIFKREKEISRMLEFEGTWISSQPGEDNLRVHWDKLVLSTPTFPQMYWDKFVKKKVINKYSAQYDQDEINALLGMATSKTDSGSSSTGSTSSLDSGSNWLQLLRGSDYQYLTWKWGVVFTDVSFLYLAVYFAASFFGNFNYFFFSIHLLDVAVSFKTLGTIIQSVTHNGKQLILTVMLTMIVIYLYTVVAFNFFPKFYVKDNDGEQDAKCNDMMTCFIFHLHTGLRAGGGIGDEIEPPDGDEWESYRIIFDLTFFFFVIIILLAIIQGLIIDAFGDLRDQLEQVKEDLESKCFICGIGKEYFDKVPHGFEQHVEKEHNFANYMYFLMHIINKPDTEYTGQETYVWELYQQRCWDFFPIGDCFRKQYEEELQPSK